MSGADLRTLEWTRRCADDNQTGREIAGHDRSRAHERAPTNLESLQDDGIAADGHIFVQVHRPGNIGSRVDGDSVREDGVVPDGGVVLDLDMVADPDTARNMRPPEDQAARAQRGVWPNDRPGMDHIVCHQPVLLEQAGQAASNIRIGNADDVMRATRRFGRREYRQPAHDRPAQPVIEKGPDRNARRKRGIVGFPAHAARARNVKIHAPIVPTDSRAGGL